MDTDNLCARLASLMRRVSHREAEALIHEAIAALKWQQAKIAECSQLFAAAVARSERLEGAGKALVEEVLRHDYEHWSDWVRRMDAKAALLRDARGGRDG